MQERRWLRGDTHLHTNVSDGINTPAELIEKCRAKGLDWIIITDHNKNAVGSSSFYDGGLLVIPGEEYTGSRGHMNIWGSGAPELDGTRPKEYGQYIDMAAQAHERGCTVSVNHPFCSKCGWHMPLESFPADCVEVWNMFMHPRDMTCLSWWHRQLLTGRRLPAVGGSDYHRDYFGSDLLAAPTTFVYARSNSEEDVLDALRRGSSFITDSPGGPTLVLSCGDCVQGDEVSFEPGMRVRVCAEGVKRGMTLQVFNNDRMIFERTAERDERLEAEIPVSEKGFVRAQIVSRPRGIKLAAFRALLRVWLPKEAKEPYGLAARCITNPMWIV